MALDGIITRTQTSTTGVRVYLASRDGGPTGQDHLLIEGATWTPHAGDALWGGDDNAFIESGGVSFPYERIGYTRLRQKW